MLFNLLTADSILNLAIPVYIVILATISIPFIVFLASLFKKKERLGAYKNSVSVMIPFFNNELTIKKCVESVLATKFKPLEIICIDDGSTDDSAIIVKALMKAHSNVKLLKVEHGGKAQALNGGLKAAKNELVITLDSDTYLDKNFITEIIKPFADPKVAASHSMVFVESPKNLLENFQDLEYCLYNLIRFSFAKVFRDAVWFFGAAACYRRKLLLKEKGFSSTSLTEDMEIAMRLSSKGMLISAVSTARCTTQACRTIKQLFFQRLRWFAGGWQSLTKFRSKLMKPDVPILFLYLNHFVWSFFSIIVYPLTAYQLFYWMPQGLIEQAFYIFRWFSIVGPIYWVYKIPEWGVLLLPLLGVMTGIISSLMLIISTLYFRQKITFGRIIAITFFFPYTLILNAAWVGSILFFFARKKAKFKD
ncbi:MAG: glycosyltransferase family 2 protein [Nanoarchaeota archaeon]|mgnify:CR=1 FL=1